MIAKHTIQLYFAKIQSVDLKIFKKTVTTTPYSKKRFFQIMLKILVVVKE